MRGSTSALLWTCPRCAGALHGDNPRACEKCGVALALRDGIWLPNESFEPPGFSAQRQEILHDLQDDHFWFPYRLEALERRLARLVPGGSTSAIELGCGGGQFLGALARRFARVVAVDGHVANLESARARSATATLVHGDVTATPFADGQFDLVVALDVLEHVDPQAFLGEAARLARPDGRVLLSVPAFEMLWSDMDVRAGHRCRYRIGQLRRELVSAGWRLTGYTHFQFLLFPLMFAARRLRPASDSGLEREPPRWLGRLLGAINAFEVRALRFRLPFGSSLFAWGRRAD